MDEDAIAVTSDKPNDTTNTGHEEEDDVDVQDKEQENEQRYDFSSSNPNATTRNKGDEEEGAEDIVQDKEQEHEKVYDLNATSDIFSSNPNNEAREGDKEDYASPNGHKSEEKEEEEVHEIIYLQKKEQKLSGGPPMINRLRLCILIVGITFVIAAPIGTIVAVFIIRGANNAATVLPDINGPPTPAPSPYQRPYPDCFVERYDYIGNE